MNQDALAAMSRRGLSVVAVDPLPWRKAMEEARGLLRGELVPAPFFDELDHARDACRAGEKPGAAR